MLKISAFLFNTSVDSHVSSTAFSCRNIILRQWWSNLIRFMNENLFNMLNCFKFHHIIHDMTASMHQQVPRTLKKWYSGLTAYSCCKFAPTLARQMWRHNYVISRNEYLISKFSESTIPWVYSLHFIFCLIC